MPISNTRHIDFDTQFKIKRLEKYEQFVRWMAQTQLELSQEKAYQQRYDFVRRARDLIKSDQEKRTSSTKSR